jgi:4-carboxymuconolactone decarboxylase
MTAPEPDERRASTAATATPPRRASRVRIPPLVAANRSAQQRRLLEPARGENAPNLFATLVINPALLEAWLPFCLYLVRCPEFSARQREMVILRTAWLSGAQYEWAQHVGFARESGLSDDEIRSLSSQFTVGWSSEDSALLEAVDQLHAYHTIGEATWNELATFLDAEALIALPMLVGQYSMLAGVLNALGIAIDDDVATPRNSIGWSQR